MRTKRPKPIKVESYVLCRECGENAITLYELTYIYVDKDKERRKENVYIKCKCGYKYEAESIISPKVQDD